MTVTFMLFGMLLNSVGVVILQSIASFGVSKSEASVLEAFKDLPIAITSFIVASFLPRLGLRRAMMIGTAIVTLVCAAMPLLPAFATAKLLFAATGASFALVKIATYASIGLLTNGSKEHASMTNILEGIFMVGVLAGYWIFSAFIHPQNGADLGWLNSYWVMGGIALLALALLATSRLDESGLHSGDTNLSEDFLAMLALMAKPLVLVFVISAFLYVLIEQGIGTWLPTFNNQVLHLPAAMSVQATSIFAAAIAIGRLGSSFLFARINWFPLVMLCIIAIALIILITLPMTQGLAKNPDITWQTAPLAVFLLPLIGLFLAPIYPALNSTMLSALPKPYHASMAGLLILFSALGGTTGSIITGLIFDQFDGQTAFYLTLFPIVILLVSLTGFRRMLPSD